MSWIKCTDRLPKEFTDVLLLIEDLELNEKIICVGCGDYHTEAEYDLWHIRHPRMTLWENMLSINFQYSHSVFHDDDPNINISHWMPLPELPNEN